MLNHYWGLPPWATIPLATIFGAVLSTVILLPVLRLRGVYFSMVTLILPLMIERIIEATKIFGGTEGLSGLTPIPNAFLELIIAMAVVWIALFQLHPHDEHRLWPDTQRHRRQRPGGDERRAEHLLLQGPGPVPGLPGWPPSPGPT